ncbi:MAG: mannonate dehydratase, partial [Chloroflexi bacterium]|nr:mannonate dehydratase [Chloroflexota bacterium]
MYVGTQFQARTDDDYRVFAQLGVHHICGYPPGPEDQWTPRLLAEYREHVESFGLTLDIVPLPLASHEISRADHPNIMLGKSPERDVEIEVVCN